MNRTYLTNLPFGSGPTDGVTHSDLSIDTSSPDSENSYFGFSSPFSFSSNENFYVFLTGPGRTVGFIANWSGASAIGDGDIVNGVFKHTLMNIAYAFRIDVLEPDNTVGFYAYIWRPGNQEVVGDIVPPIFVVPQVPIPPEGIGDDGWMVDRQSIPCLPVQGVQAGDILVLEVFASAIPPDSGTTQTIRFLFGGGDDTSPAGTVVGQFATYFEFLDLPVNQIIEAKFNGSQTFQGKI